MPISDRVGAWRRLEMFSDIVQVYGQERNFVTAGHPHVSRLSEAIKARLISEQEVVDTLLQRHTVVGIEKYIQEVFWRLYWKGWLERHPNVWSHYRAELSEATALLSDEQQKRLDSLERGHTGVKIMDRFARELVVTGYLHNHARMWFAAYWIHVAKLPWSLGADYFYRHLLDADPASNTLSWRWVAGLQTRGKAYLARADNIRKYCRYPEAADAELEQQLRLENPISVEYTLPEKLAEWRAAGLSELKENYLLWIHGEDLSFWEVPGNLPRRDPHAAIMVYDEKLVSEYGLAAGRIQQMRESMTDARARWERFSSQPVIQANGSLAQTLSDQARASECSVVAGLLPGIGPLRDQLPGIQKELNRHGIKLCLWRRTEDEKYLPLAQKGFFPFWQHVRPLLQSNKNTSG